MDNTQHTYFAELKLALQKAGYTVQAVEDGHLPIEWNDRRLCQVTESGGIRFRTDDTTDPAAEAARSRVTDIAGVVREYMTLIEQAPDLKADGLGENYKLLAEFNGAVLAGHSSRYGVEFVTWEWSCGRTGLWQGHYYDPGSGPNGYLSAKQDFCVRSGLMDQHRLFTNEQLAEVYDSALELVNDGSDLGYVLDEQGQGMPHFMERFAAALEFEHCRDLRLALDISQNLHCYEWVPRDGLKDFGRRKLLEAGVSEELLDSGCIDLEGYGADLLEEAGYVLTADESAYITRNNLEFLRDWSAPEEAGLSMEQQ